MNYRWHQLLLLTVLAGGVALAGNGVAAAEPLDVVTTLPDYASITKMIGGDRVNVEAIVQPVQDPHHVRPKPSFVRMVQRCDVLISTGLDLEMWLPSVIDKSGNQKVRSGETGYVAVSQGLPLLEKPEVISQAEGDVHVYGNPHIMCSPINARHVAANIAAGLIKNDPEGKAFYEENLKHFQDQIDTHLFGEELVGLIGGETLCKLAIEHKLINLLQSQKLEGKPVMDRLGGWMKQMMPLRGAQLVVYHKDWSYLMDLFGLEVAGDVEPKPGIPPSPKHVLSLIELMEEKHIHIILAANYWDQQKITSISEKTNAKAIIAPLFVGGADDTGDYFKLVDHWVNSLLAAAQ